MPVFNLSEDNIKRLREKFYEFQDSRAKIHKLIKNYVADYRQFTGSQEDRKEFLEDKYSQATPGLTHLIMSDEAEIYFHVQDIATILGRTQPAISITLSKIERSDYMARLLALRKPVKSANNNTIFVYKQEIFDLIIDKYEEEYLLRFSNPRRGSQDNAPDINEVKKFWNYLKQLENYKNSTAIQEHKIEFPDIPPMRLRDIFKLIWEKVFDIKIWTVFSVIFAICFEVARRFFGVNAWLAAIPAVIALICVALIHARKFSPDILSNIGAGALLVALLWISGALSVEKLTPEAEKIIPVVENTPVNIVLESEYPWIYVLYQSFDDATKIKINNDLFSPTARECVEDVIYSINNDSLDTKLNLHHYHELYLENKVFDPAIISKTEGKDTNIKFVYSQVIFKDGTLSDIRKFEF